MKLRILALSSAFLLAACTQEAAQVVHKGNNLYTQQVINHLEGLQNKPKAAPTFAMMPRDNGREIFITDNMNAVPVQTEEEFRRVIGQIRADAMAAKEPVKVVAIPVAKPMPAILPESIEKVAEEIPAVEAPVAMPLKSVKPSIKPAAPQWFAQRDNAVNVTEGFIWPVRGKIVSTFGSKQHGAFNDGINIAAPEGKTIQASADGEVVYAGNELKGYGNMIILRHNNGWMSAYAHTQKMLVGLGSQVAQGQAIAQVGQTGDVQSAQLHFGLRKDKQAVNPMDFLADSLAANY